ncbi:hypothetical protein [Mycolicibacterium sp. D5.8-2]|uniref:hypothetical protein n=1 Tax=Mycolicibacterium sp. D5.8-2 TaxID=3085903 RepID=UPI00298D170E|nr:hypothetical protein [Mycolicibacterium sp. D5.8-2]MDW5612078.1 hypothetical protein [Mycolicibacterium sp. D5.8-2]
MTTPDPTPGTPAADDTATITDPQPDPQPDMQDTEPSPNSEAARWRHQCRDAEAQRDALAERLTAYQRRECEHAVADLLDEPADLWDIGQADYTEFYDADGQLDEAQLRAAAGALIDMRPKLAKPAGPRHLDFGQFRPPPPARGGGWSDLIKG